MNIQMNGMCRGDYKASFSLSVSGVEDGNEVVFDVTFGDKQAVPFQVYRGNGIYDVEDDVYIINVPLLKWMVYHITAREVDVEGREVSRDDRVVSGNDLKWRSRYAYRFKKDMATSIRDIDRSAGVNRVDFTVSNVLFEPDEDFGGSSLLLQGRIIPRCTQSTFTVRTIDEKGKVTSRACFIEETANRKYPEGSSRSLRRLVDYSVSFECDTKTLFVIVEETPSDSKEKTPQVAIRSFNVKELWERAWREPACNQEMPVGNSYNDWFVGQHKRTEAELAYQRGAVFEKQPTFSILVPLYRTPRKFLFDMIQSIVEQTYPHWQLCLANASPEDEELRASLDRVKEKGDERILFIDLDENAGISKNTNQALKHATGDFVMLVDHDDVLEPDALYEAVKAINADERIDMLYSDEDHMISETGLYYLPNLKSDFNIDFLRAGNYITHLTIIRRSIVEEVGGFDSEFDGAQDFDIILKSSEKSRVVHHIPRVLYHWREHANSTAANIESKPYAIEAGRKAVDAHLRRIGLPAVVENSKWPCIYKAKYEVKGSPKVSVIVANQSGGAETEHSLAEVCSHVSLAGCEIIRVKKGSQPSGEVQSNNRAKVLYCAGNLCENLNKAAAAATGDYLLFLDAGMVPLSNDLVHSLLGFCQRADVGAVGAKSYYSDGTIEHAGIALSPELLTLDMFQGQAGNASGFQARALSANDVSAVSSACMMTSKALFDKLGGFSEKYSTHLFDVDYCLRLGAENLLIVFDAYAEIVHHCVKAPGFSADEIINRERDRSVFCDRWAELLARGDRFLSPNVSTTQRYWNLP